MSRRRGSPVPSAAPYSKFMFIAVAGMLIPPTLLVYAFMALTNFRRA